MCITGVNVLVLGLIFCGCRFTIDVVILTAGIQGLSAISNWFWLLWLLVS